MGGARFCSFAARTCTCTCIYMYTGLHVRCPIRSRAHVRMRIRLLSQKAGTRCVLGYMLSVRDCIVVCHCYDMQQRSPECNVSLVGSNQARVTVNNGSSVAQATPTSSRPRGVVITPLNTRYAASSLGQHQGVVTQGISASTIIPKLLIKAVCKSSTKKDACVKTFTLRIKRGHRSS